MSNKTEQPTRKRLRDSAKKGQSFKSRDLVVACLTLCGVAYLVSFGSLVELMGAFRQAIAGGFSLDMAGYAKTVAWLGLKLLLPIFLLCVAASALPALLQSGFVLASEALKLNLSALNPVNGFKKLFSLRTVKEAVKALLYLASFAAAVAVIWRKHKELLFSQLNGSPLDMAGVWRELLLSLVLTCLGCIVLVLLLDAIAEYFLFMKDMKMDKQEVKREMKEQEGNPEIKSRRREAHMEILSEQVKSDIENSRLIIANPTHIAIGIYFRPEVVPIPFVSVLETNQRALAVRAYAEKVGVPVVRDVPLARRIFAGHRRYSFVSLEEVDEVLRLLVWLEQVENAGQPEPDDNPPNAG
ncbi:EscU/YscU/HrcU family type III secretion system export apparatus switch protein [Chromobacterium subtsugae]|uniref:EscU/YscU/HrcU family type III secretion system export apparatus switch protein n=1 Tax=Chromobacterium subtsugae TaxID=251747 RepID=A0ABS7FEX3_9NEIS|nr:MULTISPECIES: EscU/YscU/HrcU family type III secretion system export apparatus switch protein [Chromobacterium]KUM05624.1 type III secretion system protein SpaS [Chromobacterium subtsugae]KZE88098.1 type III secretion system protein SpaS [Chromobacterium sp. F49]MBW7565733.1 EscU/YscU/HrcU family type III secretion system export apparatus switch protein [Chromobacterium subtsugae]MBW8288562.1 EscU/YscU/HrcU family type III secretion system export apparatus switch protein [Chromobacterium sub